MALARGFNATLSVAKEAGWEGTGSGWELVPFLSESLVFDRGTRRHPYLRGSLGRAPDTLGVVKVGGVVTVRVAYQSGLDILFAAAFGADSFTSGPPHRHLLTPQDPLSYSVKLAIDRQTRIWQYSGIKVNRMTIRGDASLDGGLLEAEYDLAGGSASSNAVAVNPVETTPKYAAMEQATFRLGDQADPLGPTDELRIAGFELTLENNLSTESYATGSSTVMEPVRNGHLSASLKVTFVRWEDDTQNVLQLRDWFEADQPLQGELKFTDGTNELNLSFPNIRIANPLNPSFGGPETPRVDVQFTLGANDAGFQNPNMTAGGGAPLWMELVNDRGSAL